MVRGRARSPRSSGTPSGSPGPWLSGRSSAVASKHRTSRSGSPGQLQPRPKVRLLTYMLVLLPLACCRPGLACAMPLLALPPLTASPACLSLHRWSAPPPRPPICRCSCWAACARSCCSSWGLRRCGRQWHQLRCAADCWSMQPPRGRQTSAILCYWSGTRQRCPASSRRRQQQAWQGSFCCRGSEHSWWSGGSGPPTVPGSTDSWSAASSSCAAAC